MTLSDWPHSNIIRRQRRETNRLTDGQTLKEKGQMGADGQTDSERQKGRQTDGQTMRQKGRQMDRH